MQTVELSETTIERLAQRVAELLRAAPPAARPDVLTRAEAKAYIKRPSEGAFVAWCKRWKVRPASRGRYSRPTLDLALDRECGLARTPATIQRHQDALRSVQAS